MPSEPVPPIPDDLRVLYDLARLSGESNIQILIERIARLDWTPITAENMPKQGDELLGRCGNGVYYVNEYGGLADYARLVAEEEWTHFRPINAPQSGGSR
jgi:hypothetical protein